MVLDAVSNFVRGTADAEVGTEDTTVSVADASIFPDPATDGEFNVVIWDVNNFPRPDQDGDVEIMRVTERDTTADELTVVRGQETTSAAAHPEGSAIHLSPTAKMFSDIESTFGDFWDAGTQELTADVNNTNTTTQALEADNLNNADLANADADTVPTAQGDGTLNMVPTASDIVEVDSGSLPLTVPSEYDARSVMVVLSRGSQQFRIRVNDESGSNYNYQEADDDNLVSTTGDTAFQFAQTTSTRGCGGVMHLTMFGDGQVAASVSGSVNWSSDVVIMTHGYVESDLGTTIDKISSPDEGSSVNGRLFVTAEGEIQ